MDKLLGWVKQIFVISILSELVIHILPDEKYEGVVRLLSSSTPTLFNGDFRRPAVVSLLRLHIAPCGSDGILTVSAIAIAVRLRLRTRLTPG